MAHAPASDILVLIAVSACMVLIGVWATYDTVRLFLLAKRGEA